MKCFELLLEKIKMETKAASGKYSNDNKQDKI